jgi:succinate dehydrogenase / fumarate reductase flavoprotein subunit
MERYTPTLLDLAPRDIVSRAMSSEIREGRGIGGGNYLHLDITHLGREIIEGRLPDITDFVRTSLGIDPVKELVPVQPTAHYAMGGIPTNNDGQVIVDERNTPMPGFYAAGECACVSVHGANRLGTNSLVDILVFGRRGARHALTFIPTVEWAPLPPKPDERATEMIAHLRADTGIERVGKIRDELQDVMMTKASVFRDAAHLESARAKVAELAERYAHVRLDDQGEKYNTELLEAIELGCLLDISAVLVAGALARQESRGAHFREDFPKRDDVDWLKHTLAYHTSVGIELKYKPVVITRFQPQERKY